jgi:hypothetical protein
MSMMFDEHLVDRPCVLQVGEVLEGFRLVIALDLSAVVGNRVLDNDWRRLGHQARVDLLLGRQQVAVHHVGKHVKLVGFAGIQGNAIGAVGGET